MTGWPLAWKCFVACLFLDESQQPTWPHVRQSRSCTHRSPVARQSSQPFELGVTGRICLICGQVGWAIAVLLLAEVVSREITPRIGESGQPAPRVWGCNSGSELTTFCSLRSGLLTSPS